MDERECLKDAIALILRLFNALPDGSGTLEDNWSSLWDRLDEQSQKFVEHRRNQAWQYIAYIEKVDSNIYQDALAKRIALDKLDKATEDSKEQ